MTLHFHLLNESIGNLSIENIDKNTYILRYPCEDNLETCTPYFSIIPPGNYIFEVWGAQGGYGGGKGGYSIGVKKIKSPVVVYISIGSKGDEKHLEFGFTTTAFNGGGKGLSHHSESGARSAGSGGGATDVRFLKNEYEYRFLVAGGGGGNAGSDTSTNEGGYGGGLNGQDSKTGKGGTQSEAPSVSHFEIRRGSFGEGGSCQDEGTAGGGGGGWFGGSTGQQRQLDGGAGGSGYALHHSSIKPSDYMLNSSYYFLDYWKLYHGGESFPTCSGKLSEQTEYETGHEDFGCARITVLSLIYKKYKNNMKNYFISFLFISILS